MARLVPPLNEIVGLPAATPLVDVACASERRFEELFGRASLGDRDAQRDLVSLRLAYLNWAYAGRANPQLSACAQLQ
jgi:hypothetical protein